MLRTVWSLPLQGLSTSGFDPDRFPSEPPICYRASWQLPGPDLHRLATTSMPPDDSGHPAPSFDFRAHSPTGGRRRSMPTTTSPASTRCTRCRRSSARRGSRSRCSSARIYHRGALLKVHPRQPRGGRATDRNDYPAELSPYTLRSHEQLQRRAAELGEAVGAFEAETTALRRRLPPPRSRSTSSTCAASSASSSRPSSRRPRRRRSRCHRRRAASPARAPSSH